MKDERINLVISPEEKKLLRKAAKNLSFETGAKENTSEAIRHSVKKYAELDLTKPELYFLDRIGIRQTLENVEWGQIHLTSFIKEFFAVTGQYLTKEELQLCFEGIGKLGSQSILQSAISELVTKKLYDRLVASHPDMTVTLDNIPQKDLTELFSIADQVNNIPEIKMYFIGIYWDTYNVSESGAVSILSDQVEKLYNNYRFFASSALELQKLAKVKELCECLNSLLKDKEILPAYIFSLVYYDGEAAIFSPTGSYIKYNSTPQVFFKR